MDVRFDVGKAAIVKEKHGVDLAAVRKEVLEGRFSIEAVRNQNGHPGQRMFIVVLDGYVVCAPYVLENGKVYFLKTAFKNRIYQRRYENGSIQIPV